MKNVCLNSDGNGGTCGNDLDRPGSMVANVLVGVPVSVQNGNIELWEWPVEPPERMHAHYLVCIRCGRSVSLQFSSTIVKRSIDNQK